MKKDLLIGFAGIFLAASCSNAESASAAQNSSYVPVILMQLLVLIPLALVAYWLKTRRKDFNSQQKPPIQPSAHVRIHSGGTAQIVYVHERPILVVQTKNGNVALLEVPLAESHARPQPVEESAIGDLARHP